MKLVYGRNPVFEVLKSGKDIDKVVILKTLKSDKLNDIINLCRDKGIRYDFSNKKVLDQASNFQNHQGVIAYVSSFKYCDLNDSLLDKSKRVVILDRIEDPHNLGAIVRTAAATGVDIIIIPERNSCQVNDTVSKVSAGNIDKVKIARVKNISNTIDYLKSKNFWIVGTEVSGGRDYREFKVEGKIGLVLGNEGEGIRRLVKDHCDELIYIPLENGVESLNVSVTAGILLFYMK
ncbi:MAG: 23S rRNA (guanosine(2251)-2'-O)-methyltransferase RlmB [Candidatus Cloacimonadota bacterium]|nr:MAG: 23S rRNA (guanosine(2251)-2'-O)-methyltransferase RlmB [Candidatus Cloacimonadota bacterium]PIE78708.1 MAG: 23S rRNA (guanosine(2251)-2'-O)-methyltransferase RlmB [Candidatus Delongbacteria bacterium]